LSSACVSYSRPHFLLSVVLIPSGLTLAGPGVSVWPPGTTPGRTYRFYTGTPVLPFGFGLSYTTWTYTPFNPPASVDLSSVRAAADAQAATQVIGHIPQALQATVVDYYVNVRGGGAGLQ
jgi:hypothetical protein